MEKAVMVENNVGRGLNTDAMAGYFPVAIFSMCAL